jgi:hypothetical protein
MNQPTRTTRITRFARVLACAASLALPGCAADDWSQPIADEAITQEEIREGNQAVEAITAGGADPAFDNGQADDLTDGETATLAPEQSEPTAAQIAADSQIPEITDGSGDEIIAGPPSLDIENDGEISAPTNTTDPNVSTNVSELRRCRRATGYIRGRAYNICVTTGNGKLVGVRTAQAFVRMRASARRAGVHLVVVSGFRTMAQQRYLWNLYRSGRGNLAARPGYSNHQSGIALDLNTASPGVYRRLSHNARRFGLVRTVPSEAWHWEYRLAPSHFKVTSSSIRGADHSLNARLFKESRALRKTWLRNR